MISELSWSNTRVGWTWPIVFHYGRNPIRLPNRCWHIKFLHGPAIRVSNTKCVCTCVTKIRSYVCHQMSLNRRAWRNSLRSRVAPVVPRPAAPPSFLPQIFVAKLITNRLQIDSIQFDPGSTPDRPKEPERMTSKTETMSGEMATNSSPSQFGTPSTRLRTQRCLSRRVGRILSCLINGCRPRPKRRRENFWEPTFAWSRTTKTHTTCVKWRVMSFSTQNLRGFHGGRTRHWMCCWKIASSTLGILKVTAH